MLRFPSIVPHECDSKSNETMLKDLLIPSLLHPKWLQTNGSDVAEVGQMRAD